MFQCEYPDGENVSDVVGEPLKLKVIQDFGTHPDAPEFIQLNWNNTVLWRRAMRYLR